MESLFLSKFTTRRKKILKPVHLANVSISGCTFSLELIFSESAFPLLLKIKMHVFKSKFGIACPTSLFYKKFWHRIFTNSLLCQMLTLLVGKHLEGMERPHLQVAICLMRLFIKPCFARQN